MLVPTGLASTARPQGHESRGLGLGFAGFLGWPQSATKLDQHSSLAVHSPYQTPVPQRLNFEKTGLKFNKEADPYQRT